jgi:transposase
MSSNAEKLQDEIEFIKTLDESSLIERAASLRLKFPSQRSSESPPLLPDDLAQLFLEHISKTSVHTSDNRKRKITRPTAQETRALALKERDDHIIALYLSKNSRQQKIAAKTKCSVQIVRNVIQNFRKSIFREEQISVTPKKAKKISEAQAEFLRELYYSPLTADLTLESKRKMLLQRFPDLKSISKETLRLHTHQNLRFTYKKLRFTVMASNTDINKQRRLAVIHKIIQIEEGNYEIIYIDECGVGSRPFRTHGWSISGEECTRHAQERLTNISCCAAITKRGIVALEFSDKPYNYASFAAFLKKLVVTIHEDGVTSGKIPVFLLDNARFHKNELCMELLKREKIPILFNAPYTPQANVIEYFFSAVKKSLARLPSNSW